MARTRTQRRRQNTLIAVGLVATALALLFARDINRAAHSATQVRRSENRVFAQMANGLITRENAFDQRLGYLLEHGGALGREVFSARLAQLADELPQWSTDATLLRRPGIAGNLNTQLAQLTEQRVDDYQTVLDTVAVGLQLPWTRRATTAQTSVAARGSLLDTDHRWDALRRTLLTQPGGVTLGATSTSTAVVTLPTVLGTLEAAPRLRVVRGVEISAVAVTPSPLPAPAGEIGAAAGHLGAPGRVGDQRRLRPSAGHLDGDPDADLAGGGGAVPDHVGRARTHPFLRLRAAPARHDRRRARDPDPDPERRAPRGARRANAHLPRDPLAHRRLTAGVVTGEFAYDRTAPIAK